MAQSCELLALLHAAIQFVEEYSWEAEQNETFEREEEARSFSLRLSSFGYKYGSMLDTDLNINIRSVENPSVKLRKNQTGLQKRFRKDFFKIKSVQNFYEIVKNRITMQIEEKICGKEPRDQIFIGIGCEFGRHRSVSFVEKLAEDLCREKVGQRRLDVAAEHRDVERQNKKALQTRGKRHHRK